VGHDVYSIGGISPDANAFKELSKSIDVHILNAGELNYIKMGVR